MKETIEQKLSQFHIESTLGTGSIGTVYKARDIKMSRLVAVKIIHPELANQALFQRRFLQAGQTAIQLEHSGIVPVYEVIQRNGVLYTSSALYEGDSLQQKFAKWAATEQRLALPDALNIVAQCADAVAYAHVHNVRHQAIKPENVFIRRTLQGTGFLARTLISDFGMQSLRNRVKLNNADILTSMLPYLSPEQVLAQPVDGRSDLYSLGALLYQLVTGIPPYQIQSPKDAVMKHLHEFPKSPHSLRPTLPASISQIIVKALAKKPIARFQNGEEMGLLLREAATHLTREVLETDAAQNNVVSLQERPSQEKKDRLLIAHQHETTRIIPLDQPIILIGRSRNCDIRLPADGISRCHLRLNQTEEGWQVTDLASTNGTFLAKIKLPANETYRWQPDQKLSIGPYRLHWH